jgi:hypothetical protein
LKISYWVKMSLPPSSIEFPKSSVLLSPITNLRRHAILWYSNIHFVFECIYGRNLDQIHLTFESYLLIFHFELIMHIYGQMNRVIF